MSNKSNRNEPKTSWPTFSFIKSAVNERSAYYLTVIFTQIHSGNCYIIFSVCLCVCVCFEGVGGNR